MTVRHDKFAGKNIYISYMISFVKKAGKGVRLTAVLVGTVVGAGFVSGAELVRFFPTENFLPCAVLAALLIFLGFALLFYCGKKYGGFEGTLCRVFKKFAPAVRLVILAASLMTSAGMLAGLDSVMLEGFGVPKSLPLLSVGVLAAVYFLSDKGTAAIGWINLCLVPAILAFVASLAFRKVDFAYAFLPAGEPFWAMLYVILYAGMNVFLAAPVVCDLGAKSEGCTGAAVAASLVIEASIVIILANIFASGANAIGADMPLLAVVGRGAAGKIFAVVSAFGIITTLFSSWYPLHARAAKCKKPKTVRALLCVGAFFLSRFGLKNIVGFAYPLLGLCGVLFLAACALRSFLPKKNSPLHGAKGREGI